jgi:DNA polymerase-1
MPIQGTEADLMKMAMLQVEKKLEDGKWAKGNEPKQLLQIHDSILIECAQNDTEAVEKLLKETMENVYPELGISLRVDVSTGNNWGELH